jgi:LacI family transcriptional regulator
MKELKKRGIRIPEDFGVVGFADEFHATFSSPELTTITHPTREIGLKAAELFFRKMEDPTFAKTVVLQTTLVTRESSKKIKN